MQLVAGPKAQRAERQCQTVEVKQRSAQTCREAHVQMARPDLLLDTSRDKTLAASEPQNPLHACPIPARPHQTLCICSLCCLPHSCYISSTHPTTLDKPTGTVLVLRCSLSWPVACEKLQLQRLPVHIAGPYVSAAQVWAVRVRCAATIQRFTRGWLARKRYALLAPRCMP